MFTNSTLFEVETFAALDYGDITADGLLVCLTQQELQQEAWFGNQLDETIRSLREKGLFSAAAGQVENIPTHGLLKASYLLLAGLGAGPEWQGAVRAAGVHAARAALRLRLDSLAVKLPSCPPSEDAARAHAAAASDAVAGGGAEQRTSISCREAAYALTEGLLLGAYRIKSYQHDLPKGHELRTITYLIDEADHDLEALHEAIGKAEAYAEGTNYARDLTNLPGNYCVPATMAEEAVKLARCYGFDAEILDEHEIAARGMGGLAEVGKGSVNPPRMITLKYQGREQWTDVLGLVGKGITFDTGGISMKKPEGMEEMISDMGGAAALLGVMHVVGKLRPKINLVVVIPAAENMPSGSAFKPGDVVTTLSGRTVEVLNTDAEGRMVLADGITYAKQLGADKLLDVATLTGAILISLGDVVTGAVTNNDPFLQGLLQISKQVGEKIWPLPNYPEYHEMLKSDVADIKNATSPRWAGSITAGLFIGTFAENTPWIHLDTGGTAWLWSEKGIEPKGGTGAMVRTVSKWICESLAGR